MERAGADGRAPDALGPPGRGRDAEGDAAAESVARATVDEHGVVTGWNAGAERLLGYSPTEILGHPAASLLAEEPPTTGSPGHEPSATGPDNPPAASELPTLRRWHGTLPLRHRDGHRVRVRILAHHRGLPTTPYEDAPPATGTRTSRTAPAFFTSPEPTSPEPTPSEPRPSEPTPSEPTPSEPTPSEPRPSEPRPSEPTPPDASPHPDWLLVSAVTGAGPRPEDEPLLRHVFLQGPSCTTSVFDTALRFRHCTHTAQYTLGLTDDDVRGLRLTDVLDDPFSPVVEQAMRQALETGEPQYRENHARAPGEPRAHAWSLHVYRLHDPDGRIVGVATTGHDITEEYWARKRLQVIAEASARIGSTLDVARTAQELAEVVVPELADFLSVDLLTSLEDVPERPPGARLMLRRIAHRSVYEGTPEAVVALDEVDEYPEGSPPAESMRTQRAVLYRMTEPMIADWVAGDPLRSARVREYGFHSAMTVPLAARGTTLGVVVLARHRRPEPFQRDDLVLAEELAARAAVCIDNALRYTRERGTAVTLQRSLLPRSLPEQTAVEVASRYLPAGARAGVGGDWFDVIPLSGSRVALVVGDVVGHGIHAAATMGRLRTAVRTLADIDLPPDELLTHLDDLVGRLATEAESAGGARGADSDAGDGPGKAPEAVGDGRGQGSDEGMAGGASEGAGEGLGEAARKAAAGPGDETAGAPGEAAPKGPRDGIGVPSPSLSPESIPHGTPAEATSPTVDVVGATCLYAVYDPVSRRCTLARAGHPSPVVVSADGTAESLDLPAGPPLGIGGLPFESRETELPEGSLLALYTDGLIESRDRDLDEGIARLCRYLTTPAASLESLCDTVLGGLLTHRPTDDVALLIARTRALDADRVATWDIAPEPSAVAEARKNVLRRLDVWGLTEASFVTELVVSELVTNAIRHAEPPIQLRLIHDTSLICEVSDASNTAPHMRRARTYDEGGRGLLLVAQLSRRWGTRPTGTGKTIWTEQSLDDGL